ncbi:hypothetical protein HK096_002968, partial [Nowakowskiella sp. JEL0078]
SNINCKNTSVELSIDIVQKKIAKLLHGQSVSLENESEKALNVSFECLWELLQMHCDHVINSNWKPGDYAESARHLRTFSQTYEILFDRINLHPQLTLLPSFAQSGYLASKLEDKLFPWLNYKYKSLTHLRDTWIGGRGIVVSVGSWHFPFALHSILTLRVLLNVTLPIEVFYLDDSDLDKEMISTFERIPNVTVIDVGKVFNLKNEDVRGWHQKPFAMLASRFNEMIFIDADTLFLETPEKLFSFEGYKKTGTVFFHDRTTTEGGRSGPFFWFERWMNDLSEVGRTTRYHNHKTVHEMESGVVVFDKKRAYLQLLGACWMNTKRNRDSASHQIHGDKETFWMMAEALRLPYHFQGPYGSVIGFKNKNGEVCGGLLHADDSGRPFWWNGGVLINKREKRDKYYDFTHYQFDTTANVVWSWDNEFSPFCLRSYDSDEKIRDLSEKDRALTLKMVEIDKYIYQTGDLKHEWGAILEKFGLQFSDQYEQSIDSLLDSNYLVSFLNYSRNFQFAPTSQDLISACLKDDKSFPLTADEERAIYEGRFKNILSGSNCASLNLSIENITIDLVQKKFAILLNENYSVHEEDSEKKINITLTCLWELLQSHGTYITKSTIVKGDYQEASRHLRTFSQMYQVINDRPDIRFRVIDLPNFAISTCILSKLESKLFPWLKKKYKTLQDLRETFSGRGIVMTSGKWHFPFALHSILTLRVLMNVTLPIEMFYLSEDITSEMLSIYRRIPNVTVIDIGKVFNLGKEDMQGWHVKPYTMLASSFKEIIFIDSDSLFLQNPEILFDMKGYKNTGTVFFHDRTSTEWGRLGPLDWFEGWMKDLSEVGRNTRYHKRQTIHEMESGVIAFDKERTYFHILGSCWMNTKQNREPATNNIHGDKETFWMMAEALRLPYYFQGPYGSVIGFKNQIGEVCGGLLHGDENGEPFWWNGGVLINKRKHRDTYYEFTHYRYDHNTIVGWTWDNEFTPFCMNSWDSKNEIKELKEKDKNLALKMVELDKFIYKVGYTDHRWNDLLKKYRF